MWQPIEDRPDFESQPMWQFIHLKGSKFHSGGDWSRRNAGTAAIDRNGPYGYRQSDFMRICADGDMDPMTARVTHWMPMKFPAPPETTDD